MESEMISRENIKPSSPTPHHLRTYRLCLLDQIMIPICVPLVLYFPGKPSSNDAASISERTQLLKLSLSLNLTKFYTFSGIIKDPLSIDCNDEGVPFTVIKFKGKLSDFLKCPTLNLQQNPLYLPGNSSTNKVAFPGANVLEIQVNQFDCGGIAIGLLVAHQVADICTLMTFLKSWAAIARDSHQDIQPMYVAQSLFPQKETLQKESSIFFDTLNYANLAKFLMRRFVFDSSAITALKAKSASAATPFPSRVEVISAFLWKCFMAAPHDGTRKPFLLTHAVNLRRRAKPSLSEKSVGNLVWVAPAQCSTETDLKGLVTKVKEGIGKVDDAFVTILQGDGYHECVEQTRKEMPKEAKLFSFTSWCNFGLYDVDYGWGMPVWASTSALNNSSVLSEGWNAAVLMDMRDGSGVEAWLFVEEKYVQILDTNEEIRKFASVDPSIPLEI